MLRTVVSEKRLMIPYGEQFFSDWVDIPRVALGAPKCEPSSASSRGSTSLNPVSPVLDLTPIQPLNCDRARH